MRTIDIPNTIEEVSSLPHENMPSDHIFIVAEFIITV
jgi:mRNA deadenylase 3'-5' endonuclease subunit Ccr4